MKEYTVQMGVYPVDSSEYQDPDGRWRIRIFRELDSTAGVYTVKEAREKYLECDTEYEAGMMFVSSYEHWKAIVKSKSNQRLLGLWREEKALQDQMKARKVLMKAVAEGNTGAARLVYEAKKEEQLQKVQKRTQSENQKREEELLIQSSAQIHRIKTQR